MIPSSFTPDDDGLNDEFGVSGFRINNIQNYQFQITNRWGEIVFYSEDVNSKWNGKTLDGNKCMPWQLLMVSSYNRRIRKSN